jgi:hypothetical protein
MYLPYIAAEKERDHMKCYDAKLSFSDVYFTKSQCACDEFIH